MINLRYHIVSLTAVFLAIGIGLTLGSTFLDRATVDNLQGQLENLESRLQERDARISDLQDTVEADGSVRAALDEEAVGLLADRLDAVPVAVVASRGVDEEDVRNGLRALVAAGADVQGIFWFTERWGLDEAGEVDDLASVLGETSDDPSRLRRMAVNALADELRDRQAAVVTDEERSDIDDPTSEPGQEPSEPTPGAEPPAAEGPAAPEPGDETGGDDVVDDESPTDVLEGLVSTGFIDYEAVAGGPEAPALADGTRLVLVGGSARVPDDLVIEPFVDHLATAAVTPLLGVATSARAEDGQISDLVTVIRENERLREIVPTVDHLEHFDGWAAMVLALADASDGIVGHYGSADGATRLLPPLPTP